MLFLKILSKFTPQNYTAMRFAAIISMIFILSSCGNRLSNLRYTGEKVSEAVTNCTEAAKNVRTEIRKVTNLNLTLEGGEREKKVNGWDTHMMLW
ncbi:hypothetical protein I5907_15270 [Panacibacter sp. DH6]|uniref:Uncharacterized protein n=1 Tax=Panacibacter microcysteis TaxID=2793269 RepID=A0A931EAX9_9BACT|nr:hypothetical protein [Panacibacter microcysteis]MBG9377604.1 hypothetical protein [Panacibacter microcysteis]